MASLFDAYLARSLDPFFARAGHPAEPEHRRAAVARAVRPVTPEVLAALRAQNASYPPSPAREAHLDALGRGAAAVVTGQQVGLFLGPLYTLYKAASAIVIARALQAETGQPVVPVFWLQTEDHDLPEIATCHVRAARGGPSKLEVPASAEDRRSIAHRTLPDEVEACLAQLREALAGLPEGPAHLEHLAAHYRAGAPWSEAFAQVLAALFVEEGLVFVDPRDPRLARVAAATVHRRAITEAGPIAEALLARSAALRAAGFEPAVHVRPGSPLSFVHAGSAEGPRHRLAVTTAFDSESESDSDAGSSFDFEAVGGSERYTRAQLLDLLEREPLRFSTSALLRPILQDTLLPTAAYVGGPGEIAYFAQLEPLYAAFDRPMPLIIPRARFVVVDDKTRRLLDRLGLSARDAALSEDELLRRTAREPAPDLRARLLAPVVAALDEVRRESAGLGLESALEKTQAAIDGALGKLAEKHDKAVAHRDSERVEEVRRLKAQLFPHDAPQERVLGFSYFAARHGARAFTAEVLASITPFSWAVQELEP